MSGLSRRSAVRLTEKQLTEQKATILSELEQQIKAIAGAKKHGESNTKEIKDTLNQSDYSSYAIIVYEKGNKTCEKEKSNYKLIIKLPGNDAKVCCFNHDLPDYSMSLKLIRSQFETDLTGELSNGKTNNGIKFSDGSYVCLLYTSPSPRD